MLREFLYSFATFTSALLLTTLRLAIDFAGVERVLGRVMGATDYFGRDLDAPGWQPYVPGQYVRIGIDVDGVRQWRAYSLTHRPRADGRISITVKAVPDGKVSHHLVHDARPGTLVHLEQAAGEFVLGHPRRDGQVRPHPPWMADGSFLVFRRLVQDVPGWWAHLEALRQALPADDPITVEGLAARVIGRWRSGAPLALAPDRDPGPGALAGRLNAFDFAADSHGLRTPHFAHVRKMNPRGAAFNDERRRIIRRGIPFGAPFDPAAGAGHGADAERGLLFKAFMASIEDQFEFLHRLWANTDDFPETHAGADALIGAALPPAPARLCRPGLPDRWLDFRRFVHATGAVYAFTPSRTTLGRLAAGDLA